MVLNFKMSSKVVQFNREDRPRLFDVPNIVWHAYRALCVYRNEKQRRRQRKRNKRNGTHLQDACDIDGDVIFGPFNRRIVRITCTLVFALHH